MLWIFLLSSLLLLLSCLIAIDNTTELVNVLNLMKSLFASLGARRLSFGGVFDVALPFLGRRGLIGCFFRLVTLISDYHLVFNLAKLSDIVLVLLVSPSLLSIISYKFQNNRLLPNLAVELL